MLPRTCWPEIASRHGAQIAMAVAGRTDRHEDYRAQLASNVKDHDPNDIAMLVATAIAMGFIDKWDKTLTRLDNVVTTAEPVK